MTLFQKLSAVLLLTNLAILGVLAYLLLWPVQLPIVYNEPFPVFPDVVRKGESIYYTMDVNKRESFVADVHKNIICNDGNLVTLAPVATNIPVGRRTITPEVTIPYKSSLGVCHIEIENTYYINPLRTETQAMRTQDFTIIQ